MVTLTTPVTVLSEPTETPNRKAWRLNSWIDSAFLGGITLLAAILRLHALSAKSFWFDEAVSAEITRLPWPQFFLALWNREANMVFYYILLHFWLLIGGTTGFIRGLSVLASVATVPVVFGLGTRLFDRSAGFAAAWLLAINAYHIRYAQEARSYALVTFLAALATWLLVRNLQQPASARWGAYTAVCVLIVYSHFFGGLVVLAHGVSLAFLKRDETPWPDFLRSMSRFAFLVIPIAIFVVHTGPGPINWIANAWPGPIGDFLLDFSGNGGTPLLVLDAIAAVVAAFAAWTLWRHEGRTLRSWAFALVFAWLLFPVLAVLAASEVQPLFVPRYFNPCLPAFVLIVAAGATRLRPRLLAWILGAAISIASFAGTASYYRKDFDVSRNDWPGAASFVFDHAQPGDGAFFLLNLGRVPFEFVRSQRHPPAQWPEALVADIDAGLTYRDFQFMNLGESLRDARPAGDRVWLVLLYDTDPYGKPNRASVMARAVYGKARNLVESRNFSGITVLLFSRTESSAAKPVQEKPERRRPLAGAKQSALE